MPLRQLGGSSFLVSDSFTACKQYWMVSWLSYFVSRTLMRECKQFHRLDWLPPLQIRLQASAHSHFLLLPPLSHSFWHSLTWLCFFSLFWCGESLLQREWAPCFLHPRLQAQAHPGTGWHSGWKFSGKPPHKKFANKRKALVWGSVIMARLSPEKSSPGKEEEIPL